MRERQSLREDRSAAGLADGHVPALSGVATDPLGGGPPSEAAPADGLPPPDTKRWVIRRKAAVVAAVHTGEITIEDACRLYQLSQEELQSWACAMEMHGLAGLRATRVQQYRTSRAVRSPGNISDAPVEPTPFL